MKSEIRYNAERGENVFYLELPLLGVLTDNRVDYSAISKIIDIVAKEAARQIIETKMSEIVAGVDVEKLIEMVRVTVAAQIVEKITHPPTQVAGAKP